MFLILINSVFISVSAGFQKNEPIKSMMPSLEPGDYYRLISVDGHIRSYRLHIPPSYNDGKPMPLVFILHGSGSGANSYNTKAISGMDNK